jgi:hypothetical protein
MPATTLRSETELSIGRMTAKSVASTSARTTPACWPRLTRCLIGPVIRSCSCWLNHSAP